MKHSLIPIFALLASAGPLNASTLVQELFDNISSGNASLNGAGDSAASAGLTGVWTVNGSGLNTANNFNVETTPALPGLPPQQSALGGVWNATNNYNTTIYATRQLANSIDFGVDRVIYFSFRANNSGDTSMGIGLASGPGGSATFIGAGLTWNNAIAIGSTVNESGNAAYTAYGTLDTLNGPYGIRSHEPANQINGGCLIVGRLTIKASGADVIQIKRFMGGDTIPADPANVTWTLTDSFDTSMVATHLLLWMNGVSGSAAGEVDAIRMGTTWLDVTGMSVISDYDAWATLSGLDSGNKGPLQDPDGDGLSNLLEYVLAGAPTVYSPEDAPVRALEGGNLKYYFFRSHRSVTEVTLTFQWSTDLVNWNDVPIGAQSSGEVTVSDNMDNTDLIIVTVPQQPGKMFVRLKATQ